MTDVENAGDVRAAGGDVEALSGQVKQVFEVVRAGAVVRLVQQAVDGAQQRLVVRAFVAADAAEGRGRGRCRVVGVEKEGVFQKLFDRVVVRVAQRLLVAVDAGGVAGDERGQDVQAEAAAVAKPRGWPPKSAGWAARASSSSPLTAATSNACASSCRMPPTACSCRRTTR